MLLATYFMFGTFISLYLIFEMVKLPQVWYVFCLTRCLKTYLPFSVSVSGFSASEPSCAVSISKAYTKVHKY